MRKFLLVVLFLQCLSPALTAQLKQNKPKLVVGVTIDQLQTDCLLQFESLFGDNGFKRLMKEGRLFMNGEYGFNTVDGASATAAIYTGSCPYVNGIISDYWKERETLRIISCVDDSEYKGWYTNDCSSPARLKITTLTDELKVATQKKSIVCSIAPGREMAVLAAGHAGDIALWKNDITGFWCGSHYYGDAPTWVNVFNKVLGKNISSSVTSASWEPLLPADDYIKYGYQNENAGFNHQFDFKKGFRAYKTSALINDEVQQVAEYCLKNLMVGADDIPDFLSVAYYAGNLKNSSFFESPLELQDIYLRLDRNIGALLNVLDQKVGLDNVLLFVVSTGYCSVPQRDNTAYRLPEGELHLDRITALLNVYLGAVFGKGDYVESYYKSEIYLDHGLIEQKQLRLKDVISRSTDFLLQVDGVMDLFSVNELDGVMTDEAKRVRNGFNRSCSGDLSLLPLPGWTFADDNGAEQRTRQKMISHVPVFFWGNGIAPGRVFDTFPMENLAPTLADILQIEKPNGSRAPSVRLY